jgi:hypothetical protein
MKSDRDAITIVLEDVVMSNNENDSSLRLTFWGKTKRGEKVTCENAREVRFVKASKVAKTLLVTTASLINRHSRVCGNFPVTWTR